MFDEELAKQGHLFYYVPEGEEAPLLGDGKTYSRALGWQSPEGNFYGQTRWVRDWYSAVFWDGEDYRLLEMDGFANSINEIPLPRRNPFEIWGVPRKNWPPAGQEIYDARDKDFYYWDTETQKLKPIIFYIMVEGEEELPRPGYHIGAAHIIVYHDIRVMWDGYVWRRYRHSMLEDDEPWLHLPEGFLEGYTNQVTDTNGRILTLDTSLFNHALANELAFDGVYHDLDDIDERLGAIDNLIISLGEDIESFSSSAYLSYDESKALEATLLAVIGESEDIIDIAEVLKITTEKTDYENALTSLQTEINKWINLSSYPVLISENDRIVLRNAIYNESSYRAKLISKIDEVRASGLQLSIDSLNEIVTEEFSEINETIDTLNENIDKFSLDGFISLAEANSLTLNFTQITGEADDIINLAETLGITSEKTALQTSLNALQTLLLAVTQGPFPKSISQEQRTDIQDAFQDTSQKISALNLAINDAIVNISAMDITSYVDNEISDVNESLENLNDALGDFSSDLKITSLEAKNLKLSFIRLESECEDLIDSAELLEITTEKTTLESKLQALGATIAPWVDQTTYPLNITSEQRSGVQNAFIEVESSKASLINAISAKTADNVKVSLEDFQDYVDEEFSEYSDSISSLQTSVNNAASDNYITVSEANSLEISLTRALGESSDIISIANSLGITTEKTAYSSAITNLQSILANWINQTSYPKSISSSQRSDILTAFQGVETSKIALQNAITNKLDSNVSSALTEYIDGEIDGINESIGNLSSEVEESFTSDVITLAEANSLENAYNQLLAESQTIIDWAEGLNITTELTAYTTSLTNLGAALSSWINNPPYPRDILTTDRTAIKNALNDVINKKVALTKKIDDLTIDGVTTQFNSRISEAMVEFVSKTEIGIFGSIKGSTGAIWVSGELLLADESDSVKNNYTVLNYVNNQIVPTYIQPNTEYYIYLANYKSPAFNIPGLPPSGDIPGTPARDFRGNLFLSQTPDYNGTLGSTSPGINARIVGKCETDGTAYADGGPFFLREINMSFIGKNFDLSDAFTEYSDFQLQYSDTNTLTFQKFDGTKGLIYVAGQLIQLTDGREVSRTDSRVTWNNGVIALDSSTISPDTLYHVYLCNNEDSYNFNSINPSTNRPYQEGELGYNASLDKRKKLFLSTKTPDHKLFDESYPGYFAREVGRIKTDGAGLFKYAADISSIRQLSLNPTHLDGLAECAFTVESATQFKIHKKKGTTGLIYVGGRPVQTYERTHANVHVVNTSDILYEYNELTPENPLSATSIHVSELVGIPIHVYLANKTCPETEPDENSVWGSLSNRIFCSLEEPVNGYLSANYSGNNARWLLTFKTIPSDMGNERVTNGSFTGSTGWTLGSGWSYNSDKQYVQHSSGTAALSQNVNVSAGMIIQIIFNLSVSSGTLTVSCGGDTSITYGVSGNHSAFLSCLNTNSLQFIPSNDFVGYIDNVSVREALSGNFLGSIFEETIIGPEITIIDDNILSATNTWSSLKIQQELNNLTNKISAASGFDSQKQFGLPLKMEFYDSTRIRIYSTLSSGQTCSVILPNLAIREVTSGGVLQTISGSPSTFYYVYLYENSIEISTSPPETTYERLAIRGAGVLVGYLGLSASNTLAGNWNTFSLYGEPERTWSANITTYNNPSISLPGIVIPPNKQATASRTGKSYYEGKWVCSYNGNFWGRCKDSVTLGSKTTNFVWASEYTPDENGYYISYTAPGYRRVLNINNPDYYLEGNPEGVSTPPFNVTISFNYPTLSQGVHTGNIILQHSSGAWNSWSSHGGYYHVVTEPLRYTSANGQIVVTRQAGSW